MAKGSNNTRNKTISAKYRLDGADISSISDEQFFADVRREYSGEEGQLRLIDKLNQTKKPTLVDNLTDKVIENSYEKTILYRRINNPNYAELEKQGKGRIGTGLFGYGYYFTNSQEYARSLANNGTVLRGVLKSNVKVMPYFQALEGGVKKRSKRISLCHEKRI